MSSSKRHFTAVVGSKEHGLYISASPSSAARKIVSKLCASSKSKKVEFCVREITNGSKKKTYGPYLGEMKKLAKPIELKGRVIRFDIKVHLKKKKTATKNGKKIGKKMRGGDIERYGTVSTSDFIFDIGNIDDFSRENVKHPDYRIITYYIIPKEQYNSQPECRTKTYNKNHYIFFSKKINDFQEKNNKIMMTSPQIVYEYVVFLDKDGNIIFNNFNMKNILISEAEEIPTFELKKLKTFLDETRISNKSFCDKISHAIDEELSKNNRNANYVEMKEINN